MAAALKGFIEVASRNGVAFSNTRENDLVIFTTSNSQRILIGTGNNPNIPASITITSNLVDVRGNLNFTGALTQTGAPFQTSRWSSNASGIHIMSNVGIGTTNPTSTLEVQGNLRINGPLASGSPSSEGVYIGNHGSGRPGIEMVGGTDAIIDFTTVGNDTRGRISYAHNVDTMVFRTAGEEKMFINSTGNLGIGRSPTAALDINVSTNTNFQLLNFRGYSGYGIYAQSDHIGNRGNTLRFMAHDYNHNSITNRDLMTFRPEGNIGINNSNPSHLLDINGTTLMRNGNNAGDSTRNQLLFGWLNTATYMHAIKTRHTSGGDNNNNAIDFFIWQLSDTASNIGSKQVMSVTSTGVGIGTGSPDANYRLDVSGNARVSNNLDIGYEGTPGMLRFGGPTGDLNYNYALVTTRLYGADDISELLIYKGNDGSASGPDRIRLRAGEIVFDTYADSSGNYTSTNIRMTINNAGNVGINTTSPGYTLDVNGPARANYFLTTGTKGVNQWTEGGIQFLRTITGGNTSGDYFITRGADDTHKDHLVIHTHNATGSGINLMSSGGNSRLFVNTNNGYVGINTITPVNRFTIKSSYGDANSGFCLDASDSATYNLRQYAFVQGGGQVGYKFDVVNVGVTNTALTLGYNGNVGIGTTPGYKLDVSGDLRVTGHYYTNNASVFYAKNSAGTNEVFLWPRWSDNVMYLNYGASGFNIRNNNNTDIVFMTNNGDVGIGTKSPSHKCHINGNLMANEIYANNWIRNYGNHGLYNETYACYFYPNESHHGNWKIHGNAQGKWNGLRFTDTEISLMMGTNDGTRGCGFHYNTNYNNGPSSWALYIDTNKNVTVYGTITGNGSGLTNLNAEKISDGTLSQARLPFLIRAGKEENANSTGTTFFGMTFPNPPNVTATVHAESTQVFGVMITGVQNDRFSWTVRFQPGNTHTGAAAFETFTWIAVLMT